jgi:hypothetical protein
MIVLTGHVIIRHVLMRLVYIILLEMALPAQMTVNGVLVMKHARLGVV